MTVDRESDERMAESRRRIWDTMAMSFGSYVEQEAKKADGWREKSMGEIFAHMKHELEEIRRSMQRGERTTPLHNAMDMCSLSAILVAKAMEGGSRTKSIFSHSEDSRET